MSSKGSAPRRTALTGWALVVGLATLGPLTLGTDIAWAAAAEKSAFQEYWALGWRILNFLILAVVLYKVAKDPARRFFRDKRLEAEANLDELTRAKEEAQAELDELKAKLENADEEIDRLVEQLTEAASRSVDRIVAEAGVQAEEIVAQAQVAAESELTRAVAELTSESARMIVVRTEEMLKKSLTSDDHQRLIEESISKMDSSRAA